MKKNKKLLKGMTLVEVVVSMIIFFMMFSTILSVMSVSMKMVSHSRIRDTRTATQAASVGKKVSGDGNLEQIGSNKQYQAVFQSGALNRTSDELDLYQAMAGASMYGDDFGFQLKTFGKNGQFGALTTPASSLKTNENRIQITNHRNENVTVKVVVSGSQNYIFEGASDDGYIHSSTVYVRTIPASAGGTASVIDFGYHHATNDVLSVTYTTNSSGFTGAIAVNLGIQDNNYDIN